MADLIPAPATLGLSSPALGPWFNPVDATTPTLPLPQADLSLALTLPVDMEWLTPAISTLSYAIATADRPALLRGLQQANGSAAFADNSLIVLLTLMPEVEQRLWTLSQVVPSPDGSPTPAANNPARPRIRSFAMEIPAGSINGIADVEQLRAANFPAELSSAADKANFIGLNDDGSQLTNARQPTKELRRPASPDAIALKNRSGMPLSANLWSFDYRGHALDPGAVANWWTFMASPGIWDNLWADDSVAITAAAAAGRVVQLCNAHEGPIDSTLLGRLNLTDLNQTAGSNSLNTAAANPAIALNAAADVNSDSAPLPRIAALPLGNYAAPATATPFAGWTGGNFPPGIPRDFVRIACLDIEQQLVGLTRADPNQANPRMRITAARNTAAAPLLATGDAVIGQVMNTLTSGANAVAMAPVMDTLWGQTNAANFGNPPPGFTADDMPPELTFSVRPLAGEGATSAGSSVTGQKVAIHFAPGALPASSWIRLWTHGLDTETGQRFRQHGGGAFTDASGEAYVVLALPDGAAAPSDPADDPVRLSFDALLSIGAFNSYFADQRFERPATVSGSALALPAAVAPSPNVQLWLCEQGAVMNRGGGQYASGQTILAVPNDPAAAYALVDLGTLDASDISAASLTNSVTSNDTLIVTEPAFAQTPDGSISSAPNGGTLIKRSRDGLANAATMGRPAPSQERRELLALERTTNTAVVGATPGRAKNHESPPVQLGHPGVPAAAEIHGPGVALAGPATDQFLPLVEERRAESLRDFIDNVSTPVTATADPGGTTTWAAALETTTHGVVGDGIVRSLIASGNFMPGQTWLQIKAQLDALPGVDIDNLIDTTTFDDDTLANAVDRMIIKTRDGVRAFSTSLLAAINRAEDFILIETPAIDSLSADSGNINLLGAIQALWTNRPNLRVLLCVPEKYLPDQTAKMEVIRKSAIGAALASLRATGGERVQLFSPIAGPGRPAYIATTTVIIDDAVMLSGSAHLWRRGLTFDSALSIGLFDENVVFGRPAAIRAARLQLLANALGLPLNFLPDDPEDCLDAIAQLNENGGGGRVDPGAYTAVADSNSPSDQAIWNPDGHPSGTSDWLTFFAALSGDAASEFNNAIR